MLLCTERHLIIIFLITGTSIVILLCVNILKTKIDNLMVSNILSEIDNFFYWLYSSKARKNYMHYMLLYWNAVIIFSLYFLPSCIVWNILSQNFLLQSMDIVGIRDTEIHNYQINLKGNGSSSITRLTPNTKMGQNSGM